MAYVTLEDLKGSVNRHLFSRYLQERYDLLHGEEPLLVKGTVDIGEDSVKVIAAEATLLASAAEKPYHSAYFTIGREPIYRRGYRDSLPMSSTTQPGSRRVISSLLRRGAKR